MSDKAGEGVEMDKYDRVALTSDSGRIGRDYQFEETIDVSKDDDEED